MAGDCRLAIGEGSITDVDRAEPDAAGGTDPAGHMTAVISILRAGVDGTEAKSNSVVMAPAVPPVATTMPAMG